MERPGRAEGKVEAYVRQQLALVGDRRHRAVVAISASELDAGAREKIRAAHGGLVAMIVEALGEMGHAAAPDWRRCCCRGLWTRLCGGSSWGRRRSLR